MEDFVVGEKRHLELEWGRYLRAYKVGNIGKARN